MKLKFSPIMFLCVMQIDCVKQHWLWRTTVKLVNDRIERP